jgi:very-short-patch-repair endonuclease
MGVNNIMGKFISTEMFKEKATRIHNNKYDYSLVKYINNITKIKIICPEHGEFEQTPSIHISGTGCRKCGIQQRGIKRRITYDVFVSRSNKIHNNKFDYSLVSFSSVYDYIKIKCPKHGIYEQTVVGHMTKGHGCVDCQHEAASLNLRLTVKQFLEKATALYQNFYNYSKVIYINNLTKIIITCPIHGDFIKTPGKFLAGQGCQKCSKVVSKGEKTIINYLTKHNIEFKFNAMFNDLRGNKYKLKYDFYLPQFKCLIEYDGEQHFQPISFKGCKTKEQTLRKFELTKKYDQIKNKYAIENGYRLFRIPYTQINNLEQILEDEFKNNFSNQFSPYFVQALD